MLIANGVGAFCTLSLALILLEGTRTPALSILLFVQALAAMAEATLILSFSTLIPTLIIDKKELVRANGLFASTDSLVLTMAPFFGSWLSGLIGLRGVLALDGISFFLAMICVLSAPWSSKFVTQKGDLVKHWERLHLRQALSLIKYL